MVNGWDKFESIINHCNIVYDENNFWAETVGLSIFLKILPLIINSYITQNYNQWYYH